MSKWRIIEEIESISEDLDRIQLKYKQREKVNNILVRLHSVNCGIEDYLKDKSKFNKWWENHISKEVHPDTDI